MLADGRSGVLLGVSSSTGTHTPLLRSTSFGFFAFPPLGVFAIVCRFDRRREQADYVASCFAALLPTAAARETAVPTTAPSTAARSVTAADFFSTPMATENAVMAIVDDPWYRQHWVAYAGITLSVVTSAHVIYSHAEPHVWREPQERWVLAVCFVAYVIAWVPVWLLPYDMIGLEASHDMQRKRCNETGYSWLQFAWHVVYFANLAAGYLTYDFSRAYLDAGGFTVRRRLELAYTAVRDWYVWYGCLGLGCLFALAFYTNQAFELSLCAPPRAARPQPFFSAVRSLTCGPPRALLGAAGT